MTVIAKITASMLSKTVCIDPDIADRVDGSMVVLVKSMATYAASNLSFVVSPYHDVDDREVMMEQAPPAGATP